MWSIWLSLVGVAVQACTVVVVAVLVDTVHQLRARTQVVGLVPKLHFPLR
jgi:hypothetical protein